MFYVQTELLAKSCLQRPQLCVGAVGRSCLPAEAGAGPLSVCRQSREESGSQGKRVNITETIFSSSLSSQSFRHILQQRASSVFTVCSLCQYDTFSLQQRFLQCFFFYTSFFCYLSVLVLQLLAAAKCYQRSYVK